MIETPLFYLYRTEEYLALSNQILSVFELVDSEVMGLSKPLIIAQKAHNELAQLSRKSELQSYTQSVITADGSRDDALMAIKLYLKACERRIDVKWKDAARLILDELRSCGWDIENESYEKESIQIRKLLHDLNTDKQLSAAVNTLKLQGWVTELQESQAAFEFAVQARRQLEAGNENINSETACRNIRISLELVFNYIDVMNKIQPNKTNRQIIDKINEVIKSFNASLCRDNVHLKSEKNL